MLYKDLRHVLLWEERRKTKLDLWVHSLCNHLSIEDHIEIYVLLDLFLSVAKVLLSCSEIHGAEVYMPNPFEDKNPIKFSKKNKTEIYNFFIGLLPLYIFVENIQSKRIVIEQREDRYDEQYLGDVCQIDGWRSTIPSFSSRFCPRVSNHA